MRLKMVRSMLLVACLVSSGLAYGTIARYAIDLRVDSVEEFRPCDDSAPSVLSFGCVAVGDVFHGSFGVDTSILSTDGIVTTAQIFDFKLPLGNAFYSTGADNLTLLGFRNGAEFADAPGFVIKGGEVVDFYGGVFGGLDYPFIDMYPYFERNRFSAADETIRVLGDLLVHRVPEPSLLSLFGLALGGLVISRRKRIVTKENVYVTQ